MNGFGTSTKEVLLPSSLSRSDLLRFARHGAQARLTEIRSEIASIESAFPEMGTGRPTGQAAPNTAVSRRKTSAAQPSATASDSSQARSRRRGWTAAQRKAAGERMKAYWAKRKAGGKN